MLYLPLEIDVGQRLPVGVADDEARRPGHRRTTAAESGARSSCGARHRDQTLMERRGLDDGRAPGA
jgi:hypothetical protein